MLFRILGNIALKLNERFNNILQAFRYFDTDHTLSLTLNEFAQGIEFLRIKLSFEDVKMVFKYLDINKTDCLSFEEFR